VSCEFVGFFLLLVGQKELRCGMINNPDEFVLTKYFGKAQGELSCYG
jgi:hypothetical protein